MSEPALYIAAAVVLGLGGGWLFHYLWRRVLPRARTRQFWSTVPVSIRGMLSSEATSDLLRHYRALVVEGLRYGGRSTAAVLIAVTPVIALALVLRALDPSARLATNIAIHPADAIAQIRGATAEWQTAAGALLLHRAQPGGVSLSLGGRIVDLGKLTQKHAICTTTMSCLLFQMMLFRTHSIDAPAQSDLSGSIVVRPLSLAGNPLWPYLNDLDFGFFIALISGGAAAAWWERRRRSGSC